MLYIVGSYKSVLYLPNTAPVLINEQIVVDTSERFAIISISERFPGQLCNHLFYGIEIKIMYITVSVHFFNNTHL